MSSKTDEEFKKKPLDLKSSGLEDIAMQAFRSHAQEKVALKRDENPKKRFRFVSLSPRVSSHLLNFLFVSIFITIGFLLNHISHQLKGKAEPSSNEHVELVRQDYFADKEVNVHRGPGDDYEVVGVVSVGQVFKNSTIEDNWIKADYGKFIKEVQLVPLPKVSSLSFQETKQDFGKKDVFDLPYLEANKVGYITINKGMNVAQIREDWFQVETGGFVNLREIEKDFLMKVKEEKALIRPGPGVEFEIVGAFYKDKILKVLSAENGWAKISDGQFISLKELEKIKVEKPQATK